MIVHNDIEQGSFEWHQLRAGKPTGSEFSKLVTPSGAKSNAINEYAKSLAADLFSGTVDVDRLKTKWILHGSETEPIARSWYEFHTLNKVHEVGFVQHEYLDVGVSPDGLLVDRGLEIKCPSPKIMFGYLCEGKIPDIYIPQVQGSMWICEKDCWDFVAYSEDMPPLLVTVQRDERFIATLVGQVKECLDMRDHYISIVKEKYYDQDSSKIDR